jgi:hypothetical protein
MRGLRLFLAVSGVVCLIFAGCDSPAGQNQDAPEQSAGSVDPAFWFGEIYDVLLVRVGQISSERYSGDIGQIANCKYVCDAINAKWGTSLVPVPDTELQVADCKYLLEMVDMANGGRTNFGTSSYATLQVVDDIAVNQAVATLWRPPGPGFVVVSSNIAKAAYSSDGITWTRVDLPSGGWSGIAYGNGQFVTVSSGRNKAIYSSDGITWTEVDLPSGRWSGIACGNGNFVVVDSNSNKTIYSSDGITWTEVKLPSLDTSTYWRYVAYGKAKFVAFGSGSFYGSKVIYSSDGITWTKVDLPFSASWSDVAYGNGSFVAVNSNSSKAAYSSDGISWTEVDLPGGGWSGIAYGNGQFATVSSGRNKAIYSSDGITWTEVDLPSGRWSDVAYGNGKFVAVNSNSNKAIYSSDGITWTEVDLPSLPTLPIWGSWGRITYGGELTSLF